MASSAATAIMIADTPGKVVIGLEVHVQLNTRTKLFSRMRNKGSIGQPNRHTNYFDLAYPGTLPVLNQSVLEKAIRFGLAIGAPIAEVCSFDRKNYFYPDLPKGYQITQFTQPIVGNGTFDLWLPDGKTKQVGIRQVHLEEDAGRSLHDRFPNDTALDFNRAGVPLLEIVTEPELRTPAEAAACFRQLGALVVWLDLCDGKLSEGAIRCDANVSIRSSAREFSAAPVELKNLNSFKFLEKALHVEVERQTQLLVVGKDIRRETRSFDPAANVTKPLRQKEQPYEYRYMPDPDLPPVSIPASFVANVAASMPELPATRRDRFINNFGLSPEYAYRLTLKRPLADYFEQVATLTDEPESVANEILGKLAELSKLNPTTEIQNCISVKQLADLIHRMKDGTITRSAGVELLNKIWDTDSEVDRLIQQNDLTQTSDNSAILNWVAPVLEQNSLLIPKLLEGETKLFEFLVGEVMKRARGKANPQQVRKTLENRVFMSNNPSSRDTKP